MHPKGGLADSLNALMLIVGLTGGMGVGKSTVAGFLSDLGAEGIDVEALGPVLLSWIIENRPARTHGVI